MATGFHFLLNDEEEDVNTDTFTVVQLNGILDGQTANLPISGSVGDSTPTLAEAQQIMVQPGTMSDLHFKVTSTNTFSVILTVTVFKNGVATTLTLDVPASSTSIITDLINSFTFVAGDLLSILLSSPVGSGVIVEYTVGMKALYD